MIKPTDIQVITECIKIAQENGWDVETYYSFRPVTENIFSIIRQYKGREGYYKSDCPHVNEIVFDHDFAKALFGNKRTECEFDINGYYYELHEPGWSRGQEDYCVNAMLPAWQYHIQQLALSDDRIDYLRDWLQTKPE